MSDHIAALRRQSQAAVDAAKARFARWHAKHGAKLATMHPDVGAEVRSTVADRFMAGIEAGLSDKDLHECRMRVASRLRIKRYGACSDDEEAARQLRESLGAIGGEPAKEAA